MILSRRQFGAAAIGGAFAPLVSRPASAQSAFVASVGPLSAAVDAIRAYGTEHLTHFGLPGMTVGLTTPAGFSTMLNFGFADRQPPRLIGPDTLFQIGSITKVMTAAIVHQLASEGGLRF